MRSPISAATAAMALAVWVVWAGPAVAAEASVADVLRRHVEARGGLAAIRAIETVVYSGGTYSEPGYTGSGHAFMAFRRPHFKRVGDPTRDGYAEGWDGSAWEWLPEPGMVVRTVGEASAAMRHGNDLEGPLVEPQAKDVRVELAGTAEVDGRTAYRLITTLRDGFRSEHYLDAETFLVVAEKATAPIHAFGEPVTRWTRVSDHREVAGVLFPFRHVETEIATGEPVSSMQWGEIEANRDLPDAWFSPPEGERSTLVGYLERLFQERTDPAAVLWTYAELRRAHPELDTRAGIEAVGFQMVKMGDAPESAVALLEANLADHPESADAAFALGRALASTRDEPAARRLLERALALDSDHARAQRLLGELTTAPEH